MVQRCGRARGRPPVVSLGDAGGEVQADSVWIHLDAAATPARIEDFGIYADATAGRRVSTKLELPDPPPGSAGGAGRCAPRTSTSTGT